MLWGIVSLETSDIPVKSDIEKWRNRKRRNITRLTSTISTSLVLFLLGIIALLGVMATQLTVYVRGNMGFSVVLDENVTDAQIKTLQKRLTAAPYARKVQYISKSDALKELYMELGENPEDLLGYNPLRPSFEVKLNSDYTSRDSCCHDRYIGCAHSQYRESGCLFQAVFVACDGIGRSDTGLYPPSVCAVAYRKRNIRRAHRQRVVGGVALLYEPGTERIFFFAR